jgi:hypothetical protein
VVPRLGLVVPIAMVDMTEGPDVDCGTAKGVEVVEETTGAEKLQPQSCAVPKQTQSPATQ